MKNLNTTLHLLDVQCVTQMRRYGAFSCVTAHRLVFVWGLIFVLLKGFSLSL